MGPESTGSQACLQWAHWTLRAAASLAPERVSSAMEFFFWQWGQVRSTKTWSGPLSVVQDFIGACQHFLRPLAEFVLLPPGGEGDGNVLALPVHFQGTETSQH